MRPQLLKLISFAAGFGILAFLVQRQRDATASLREKAEQLRAASLEHTRLREEHAALEAHQVSPDELAELRADQAEASHLRTEGAALRGNRESVPLPQTAVRSTTSEHKPTIVGWTNAGRATPNSTFQTGVWAVIHGDTDTLAKSITFDAEGRALVDAQFARLPEKDRALYGSAEKVFATLLAVRLPQDLTSATVTQTTEGSESTLLRMRLQRADGSSKESNFNFTRTAGDDGWRILVPTNVVKNYQLMLTAPGILHIQ